MANQYFDRRNKGKINQQIIFSGVETYVFLPKRRFVILLN